MISTGIGKNCKKLIGSAPVFLDILIIIYLLLMIPGPLPPVHYETAYKPFTWSQDNYWHELERNFVRARGEGCQKLDSLIKSGFANGNDRLDTLSISSIAPGDSIFVRLETDIFNVAVMVAACPQYLDRYQAFTIRLRNLAKRQSQNWNMSTVQAQTQIYRLLYGSRAALEEIMLQAGPDTTSPLMYCNVEPSATPSARILDVAIHSGDILVSRGGVPTSALIARGNDYQGNFSHIALVYVDPETKQARIIESHIERGVTVSTLQDYLRDTKLRVMILRLRHDLPAVAADPMLPHKVARAALNDALGRHIPYDFEMDSADPSRMFCSEVAFDPYYSAGITLWSKTSHISSPAVISWLSYFGVTHFETPIPSDLEYDPQLAVVAEWRDNETLYKDHVDNAVTDAMLEGAEKGDKLNYDCLLLPLARLLKGYSWILNRFSVVGPIPEGMNAEAALRNKYYSDRHRDIKAQTLELAANFQSLVGYRPPYWDLLQLARQAKAKLDRGSDF